MSSRAIVMEVVDKHYIVLTPEGEFRKVPRRGRQQAEIGDEIALRSRRRRVSRRSAWTWTSAALVVLLLFPIFMVPKSQAEPVVAYVTLDVNPSVEMGISSDEGVLELHGLNEEGEKLIIGLDYEGENAADIAAAIISLASGNSSYQAGEDHDIVVASVVTDEEMTNPDKFEAELEADIREALKDKLTKPEKVTILSVPAEVREEAVRSGVSTGKMAIYLLTKSKNPDVELGTLKEQSIHDWTAPVGGLQSVVEPKPQQTPKPDPKAVPAKPEKPADKQAELKRAEERLKWEKKRLKELLEQEKKGTTGENSSEKKDRKGSGEKHINKPQQNKDSKDTNVSSEDKGKTAGGTGGGSSQANKGGNAGQKDHTVRASQSEQANRNNGSDQSGYASGNSKGGSQGDKQVSGNGSGGSQRNDDSDDDGDDDGDDDQDADDLGKVSRGSDNDDDGNDGSGSGSKNNGDKGSKDSNGQKKQGNEGKRN